MPNMRIISTNLTDTAAVTASTSVSGFSIDNVKTDYKSTFHRSTGTSVDYFLTWGSVQTLNAVSLPCTNLTSAATIAVTLYSDASWTTQIVTSGTINACPDTQIASLGYSSLTGSLFQLGVLSKTSVWFPSTYSNVRSIKISLVNSVAVDCARIVCGSYWQPTYNASRDGLDLNITDTSQNSRTDAGDLVSDRGFIHDELQLQLALLTDTDRNNLLQLMRTVGTNRNILVSVFPSDYTDTANRNKATEQQYTVYGKRNNSNLNYIIQGYSSSTMQITGW